MIPEWSAQAKAIYEHGVEMGSFFSELGGTLFVCREQPFIPGASGSNSKERMDYCASSTKHAHTCYNGAY